MVDVHGGKKMNTPFLLTPLQEQEHILLKKEKVANSNDAEAGQVGRTL